MTTGAAFDLAQAMGWKHRLNAKPAEAPRFYISTAVITVLAVGLNFLGVNPMKALVWAGIVQGFSTPPLLLLILVMTNNRRIMGNKVNSRSTNVLAGATTLAVFAASFGLVATWFI
jgi:Mn2+/Fe2+ NRAMP family transporter